MKYWMKWLYGLLAAAIGGGANGVAVVIVAPETFNLQAGLSKLLTVTAVFAIVSASMYLKQSPLPKECIEDTKASEVAPR